MSQECVLRPSDCFRFAEKESHLWIVLSDPDLDPDGVLIVNVTTLTTRKDRTCVLRGGCHQHITHESCINYALARVYTAARLTSLLARDIIYGSVCQVAHNCFGLFPCLVGERPARPFPGLARPHPLAHSLG